MNALLPALFLIVLAGAGGQSIEAEVDRQRAEIERLDTAVTRLEAQADALAREVERPICTVELDPATGVGEYSVGVGSDSEVELGLVSVVNEAPACLPVVVDAIAVYADAQGNLVCSGVVRSVARPAEGTGLIALTLRPWNMRQFVRWRNEPPRSNSGYRILLCYTPDGLTEVSAADLSRVRTLRLRIVARAGNGGVASEDLVISSAR